jgi:hypothetical protein
MKRVLIKGERRTSPGHRAPFQGLTHCREADGRDLTHPQPRKAVGDCDFGCAGKRTLDQLRVTDRLMLRHTRQLQARPQHQQHQEGGSHE